MEVTKITDLDVMWIPKEDLNVMKLDRFLALIVCTSLGSLDASAQVGQLPGRVNGYLDLVEATEEADGPSLQVFRTWSVEMEKSREAMIAAVRDLPDRKVSKLVESIEDRELAGFLANLPPDQAKEKFLARLERDVLELEVLVAESLAQADRNAVRGSLVELQGEVQDPGTTQAFETGTVPPWSSRAAGEAGEKVGEVVGKPIGTIVGPALGAVLTSGAITLSATLRLPVYLGIKFISNLGKGFYYGWMKTRVVRDVIARWAKAGWAWAAGQFRGARDAVVQGWNEVREWLRGRFGNGNGNGGSESRG